MASVLYANDEKGEYPASYYAATASALERFPELSGEHSCDVAIIGGGFSGLSAALTLAEKGFDVALLDAHRVGWGASGRNGGQIDGSQRQGQEELEDLVGREDARKLWDIAQRSLACIHDLAKKHNIDYEFQAGSVHADHRRRFVKHSQEHVEFMRSQYDCDWMEFLDEERLRALVPSKAYFGGYIDKQAGHIHPLKFALGLAKAAASAGVNIFEQSEVTEIVDGQRPKVKTAGGTINCDHLILACNGYLGHLDKYTARRVMPINNYILATEPLSEETAKSLIANNAAVSDSKFVINYYRLSKDRRLLFGGRESYRYTFPRDIKSFVRKAMLSIYPHLSQTRIDYGWGGTLAITMSRMPFLNFLKPNKLAIGGYSGHGVAMATFAGQMAAEAISGNAEQFDVMSRVPTPKMPGGLALRVPLLSLAMFYYSMRDKI